MLFLLSPAKTLDYTTPVPSVLRRKATEPLFGAQAAGLIDRLRRLGPDEVAALMDLSDDLARLNVARYAAWSLRADDHNSRPAAWAFDGDVYDGLAARQLGTADWNWAQSHLVILSGLYGLLRPLDRLQPYRLEMGTRLATSTAADLYGHWSATVTAQLNAWLAGDRSPVVVNLASQEYARVVDRRVLNARVVDCVFEDWKNGEYKVISFFAKRARGALARWAIRERAGSVRRLRDFAVDGYGLDPAASSADRLVYRRRQGAELMQHETEAVGA